MTVIALPSLRGASLRSKRAEGSGPTMSDDSGKPESGAGEARPPKIKAEDNPWYLLATLYGVPKEHDEELKSRNRIAWNRRQKNCGS
jgi:hypothetical protein